MALNIYNKVRHEVRYFLLRRLPTCKNMTSLMSESMERPLSTRERLALNAHLLVCAWCAWYLEQLHEMRQILQRGAADAGVGLDEKASLSSEARERIKRALSASDDSKL
jgi:hypothetical protein